MAAHLQPVRGSFAKYAFWPGALIEQLRSWILGEVTVVVVVVVTLSPANACALVLFGAVASPTLKKATLIKSYFGKVVVVVMVVVVRVVVEEVEVVLVVLELLPLLLPSGESASGPKSSSPQSCVGLDTTAATRAPMAMMEEAVRIVCVFWKEGGGKRWVQAKRWW